MSQRNCQNFLFNEVGKIHNEIEYEYAEKPEIYKNNKRNIPNFVKYLSSLRLLHFANLFRWQYYVFHDWL